MRSEFQKRSKKQAFLRFGYRFRSYADSALLMVFQKDSNDVNYIALD